MIFLAFFCFSGCAAKKTGRKVQDQIQKEEIADIKNFPQNLLVYAAINNPDVPLLSWQRQNEYAARFADIYFGPWQMKKTSVKKKDISIFFKRARGYKKNGDVWLQPEWDELLGNANLAAYPSLNKPAITVSMTNLRELPTDEIRTDRQEALTDYPFDYFQYSLLQPGMPLLVAHISADKKWCYVECPIASGWVARADIGFVDEEFMNSYRTSQLVAIIRDGLPLEHSGKNSVANIGALFPLKYGDKANYIIHVPVQGRNGLAGIAEAKILFKDGIVQPMPITPDNVARLGNNFMGQKYGWGGTLGERDCSAMIRDLFTPFGIWLPRNSVAQARRGYVVSLADLNFKDKSGLIEKEGVPFLSLLGMKGHIGLYVGMWKGQPAMFHNAWGIRVVKNGDDNERFVIGKTVVTSISPGNELANLYLPKTFTDRLITLTTPGREAR